MDRIKHILLATPDGKAKYDAALKSLLANKQLLARILKHFVPEFTYYSLEDIEQKYIEPETISVSKTGVAYAARRLSAQLHSPSYKNNYGCLQKVYSIWLCMGDVPDSEAGTASLYHTVKHDMIGTVTKHPSCFDLMNVIVLRLNEHVTPSDHILKLLQSLCSDVIDKTEKLNQLKAAGIRHEEDIKEAVNSMCNLSELIEERGIQKGLEQGLRQGRGEGASSMCKSIALKMLLDGVAHEQIANYTDVSIEQLKAWEAEVH